MMAIENFQVFILVVWQTFIFTPFILESEIVAVRVIAVVFGQLCVHNNSLVKGLGIGVGARHLLF